jgi:hypothetical protein
MTDSDRWLKQIDWHLDRLKRLSESDNPLHQQIAAVHLPIYEGYRKQIEETGKTDSAMYEMVWGNE